nr:hypothetical protein [Micromonospora sp. DSM 115978]
MAYEVGAVVPLGVDVRNQAGTLVNADTVGLTIGLPSGTSTPASPTNPPSQTGQYGYDYTTTVPGRHTVRWLTTSPATAYTDVFHVYSPTSAAIVGLAETKRHLNMAAADQTHDEELRGFILSVSEVVEDIVGVVARRPIVETNSGGDRHIVLSRAPVIEVTEVLVDGDEADPGDYTVSPAGLLTHRSGWPPGHHNVQTTYVVGRAQVPPNILNGTMDLIRINWRPQEGGNYSPFDGGQGDDFGPTELSNSFAGSLRLGFFVPNTVMQRLAPQQRPPVVL